MSGRPARGFTLLEVTIALVILGLVATGFLETFAGAIQSTADARVWAQALVYAEEGQEGFKIEGRDSSTSGDRSLGGGFTRRLQLTPWSDGVERVTVVVTLPGGATLAVDRLVPAP